MGFMLFTSFILVPFSYFYTEEVLDDYSAEVSTCSKILTAGKYTAFTNLFSIVLLFAGLSFKLQAEDWGQGKEWVKQLFDLESSLEKAISFCVACLTVFGGGLWSVFTSYGMAVLPSLMISQRKSEKEHIREINFNLSQIEDKIKEIEMKPNKTHRKVVKEKKELQKEQKRMIKISEKLKNYQESFVIVFIRKVILPFRILIGSVFALMSVSFLLSLLIGCVNRLMYSDCGYRCGFMTDKNTLANPLDYFLVHSSPYFPLDYLIFIVLVTYKYIASLFAIISVGIRVFCVLVTET
jgi:LMBR1 domain-containing protein 1